jgi:hypothetical protein
MINMALLVFAASQLDILDLTSLQDLTIRFIADVMHSVYTVKENWTSHPDYVNHAQCIPFNLALRKLATRLQKLHLLGGFFVTPELFCPNGTGTAPEWNIKELKIQAHPGCTLVTTKDGNQYFPSRWPYLQRDEDKHAKLAVAITRAMVKMPKLDYLGVELVVRVDKEGASTSGSPEARFVFEKNKWTKGEKRGVIGGLYRKMHRFDWTWKAPGQAEWYWTEFRWRVNNEAEGRLHDFMQVAGA